MGMRNRLRPACPTTALPAAAGARHGDDLRRCSSCIVGTATGEVAKIHPAVVSGSSLLTLGYLVIVGSCVAYSACGWLVRHASSRLIGTYAFVNPVVAVLLGFVLLHERLTGRTLLATAVISVGVATIVLSGGLEL
jgi:drug/metabolite transporter (DMT)-like permease